MTVSPPTCPRRCRRAAWAPRPWTRSILNHGSSCGDGPDPSFAPDTPILRASDIEISFGGVRALGGVSLDVRQGEIVGLIGSNGAGKSTLMNIISGFLTADTGSVELLGHDVTTTAPHERARLGMGRVFQDARLFPGLLVREALQLSLEADDPTDAIPAMLGFAPARHAEHRKRVSADAYLSLYGLNRYADAFIADLSTGTRRIVELACLTAQGARLLLLDEPTAGVAQRETEAFAPLIQQVRSELDASVLIIEHDMPMIMSISDRVHCFSAGLEIAAGDPNSVRNDPAVVAAYLGTDERAIARSGDDRGIPSAVPRSRGTSRTTRRRRTPLRAAGTDAEGDA